MQIAVICEYNPFHLGHAYQIAQIRARFGEDACITAVLGGLFSQRGEPYIAPPYVRAQAAVCCGADLVLELPYPWSAAPAAYFARAGVEIVRSREGADPGAVLFDSLAAAKARNVDVVLCDTAGRLHNKVNLMNELGKLRKIIDRETPDAAKETLLVLDATTGQNGLQQAKVFRETAGLTGIILTKLDGTAKGGICVAIAQELGVPVKYVGLGEGIDDLQPFNAEEYVKALI